MDAIRRLAREDCLGQTCMKWQGNGELSAVDRDLILQRLMRVDGCSSPRLECWVFSEEHVEG